MERVLLTLGGVQVEAVWDESRGLFVLFEGEVSRAGGAWQPGRRLTLQPGAPSPGPEAAPASLASYSPSSDHEEWRRTLAGTVPVTGTGAQPLPLPLCRAAHTPPPGCPAPMPGAPARPARPEPAPPTPYPPQPSRWRFPPRRPAEHPPLPQPGPGRPDCQPFWPRDCKHPDHQPFWPGTGAHFLALRRLCRAVLLPVGTTPARNPSAVVA